MEYGGPSNVPSDVLLPNSFIELGIRFYIVFVFPWCTITKN